MNLGISYGSLGDFRRAIEYHEKALQIAINIGDHTTESGCYLNLGNAYSDLGDFKRTIECYRKALQTAIEIGYRKVELACYNGLGKVYNDMGDFKHAIEYNEKSLQMAIEIGDRVVESKSSMNLGISYGSLGDFRRAIEYNEKSLQMAIEIGDRATEAKCYTNLGVAYAKLDDFGRSIENYSQALKIAIEIGDVEQERMISFNIGIEYNESNPRMAYNYLSRSIELSEIIRGKLVEEHYEREFQAKASDAYQLMVPLSLKLESEKEALEYTERSKSRAFLDLMATTDIEPTVEPTSEMKALLKDEQSCLIDLRAIQTRNLRPPSTPLEIGKVDAVREKLNQIYDRWKNSTRIRVRPQGKNINSGRDAGSTHFVKKRDSYVEYLSRTKKHLSLRFLQKTKNSTQRQLSSLYKNLTNMFPTSTVKLQITILKASQSAVLGVV